MSHDTTGRHEHGVAPGTSEQRAAILAAPAQPPRLRLPLRPPLRPRYLPAGYMWRGRVTAHV